MSKRRTQLLVVFKAVTLMGITWWASDDAVSRFLELAVSDNPFRNRLIFLFIWGLACGTVLMAAYLQAIWLRIALGLPLTLLLFFALAYRHVTEGVLNYSELFSMWTARDNMRSAIYTYWQETIGMLLLALVFLAVIVLPGTWSGRSRVWHFLQLVVFPVPVILIFAMVDLKGGAAALGMPVQAKVGGMLSHVLYSEANDSFDELRQELLLRPTKNGVRPHLVYIIDESVRGDFLSINNAEFDTTPFLRQQSNRLFNFGRASAAFDCSHSSNVLLRYGVYSQAIQGSVLSYPSIWAYAKNAGYHTTYIDAQRRHGQMQNFMSVKERMKIDNFIQFSSVDAVERSRDFIEKDHVAAKEISEILKSDEPQFILLNKEGSHAPYEGKYPESETVFKPAMRLGQSLKDVESKEVLYNSYRNAIKWTVDRFFNVLMNGIQLDNTVIVYTADHGQNLLEQGIVTHCGQADPPQNVALVPLFVMTEQVAYANLLRSAVQINSNKASHFNIFKFTLDVMGYDVDNLPFIYDASILEPLDNPRFFYTGNILTGELRSHEYLDR